MDELERVAQMVADGRITAEEGDRLIAVLRSVQATSEELDETTAHLEDSVPVDAAAISTTQNSAPSVPPLPAALPRAPLPPLGATAAVPEAAAVGSPPPQPHTSEQRNAVADSEFAPAATKWVRVELLAGNLTVSVDPTLTEPAGRSGSSDLSFEATAYGFRLASSGSQGIFGSVLGKFRTGDFTVSLPVGFGVELAKTAGDIELRGVPYLRGTLSAGDLDAFGLQGVDFTALAGDVYASLILTGGRHRLNTKVGDIEAVLLPGSHATVEAEVSVGQISAEAPFKTERRTVGHRTHGVVGAGTATLELRVTAGSIEVRSGVDDE